MRGVCLCLCGSISVGLRGCASLMVCVNSGLLPAWLPGACMPSLLGGLMISVGLHLNRVKWWMQSGAQPAPVSQTFLRPPPHRIGYGLCILATKNN